MVRSSRLAVAAALCVVSLGLGWSSSMFSTGYQTAGMNVVTTYTTPFSDDVSLGLQYMPGWWIGGDPFRTRKGHDTDVRVVLVPAAVVLGLAARRPSPSARLARASRIAVVAIGVLALVAVSRGMYAAAMSMIVAFGAAAPVVWPERWLRRAPRGVRAAVRG